MSCCSLKHACTPIYTPLHVSTYIFLHLYAQPHRLCCSAQHSLWKRNNSAGSVLLFVVGLSATPSKPSDLPVLLCVVICSSVCAFLYSYPAISMSSDRCSHTRTHIRSFATLLLLYVNVQIRFAALCYYARPSPSTATAATATTVTC